MEEPLFIAGIDTDVGKTIITGLIAKYLLSKNKTVITQKIAQTGCKGISEDILKHREIMNIKPLAEDINKITCPFVFNFPASPHLSAKLQNTKIDINTINKSTEILKNKYEYLLIEGVGGLFVPLTTSYTTIDYLEEQKYSVVLVTTPKLGSINHTLMSIDSLYKRKINILGIVYNLIGDYDEQIKNDSKIIFQEYLNKYLYKNNIIEIKNINGDFPIITEFSCFFNNKL